MKPSGPPHSIVGWKYGAAARPAGGSLIMNYDKRAAGNWLAGLHDPLADGRIRCPAILTRVPD